MPAIEVQVALRWSDMDAYGHVNNVEFARLLEEARIRALPQGGAMLDSGLVVAAQRMVYLRPLVYRIEPIRIEVWVSRLAVANFDFAYRVYDDGGVVCAQAESTMVPFDLIAQHPRRLAADEAASLRQLTGEPITWRRFGPAA